MSEKIKVKINEEFRPAPQLKKLYWIYFVLAIFLGVLWWCIPVILFAPPVITVCISLPIMVVLIFTAYWIPKYYDSIVYKLTENEIIWKRGVWFKNTGIVPYNRITNIDITQGPISRKLGIAALKIQTAGYSGQQTRSEIRINGIEEFEELREVIMGFVKGKKPVAVETYEEENIDSRILNEVVRIRKLLEKYSKTR